MNMKKILVLLLTITMLTSAFSPALSVFANTGNGETEDTTIKYVSLGDSMSNGLGFDKGYDKTDNPGTSNDGKNGYLEVAPDAYPAQFAAWLAGYEGEIQPGFGANVPFVGSKGTVELTQLATSGARAEDILYMLYYDYENPENNKIANPNLSMMKFGQEDQGTADWWVKEELLGNGDRWGTPMGGYDDENKSYYTAEDFPYNEKVAEVFQKSVADADIISYSGANGNFGVFFIHRVLNIVGLGSDAAHEKEKEILKYMTFENAIALLKAETELEEDIVNDMIEYVTNIYDEALVYMEENNLPKNMMVEIADYLTYITASYLVTFDKTMDYIAKVNPDAEVMILPLINNATNFRIDVTYDGEQSTLNVGEMLDKLYGSINAYTALYTSIKQMAGDSKGIKFYYASLPTKESGETIYVETFVEVLHELYVPVPENTTVDTYPEGRYFCHDRFIGDIRGFIFPILVGSEGTEFTKDDVKAYEIAKSQGPAAFVEYCSANAAKVEWITKYLGVIDAIMTAMDSTTKLDIDALGDLSNANVMNMVMPYLNGIEGKITSNAIAKAIGVLDEETGDFVYSPVYHEFRDSLIESNTELYFDTYYNAQVETRLVPTLSQYLADPDLGPMLIGLFELDLDASDLEKTLRLIELDCEGDTRFENLVPYGFGPGVLAGYHNQISAGVNQGIADTVDNNLKNNSDLQMLMVAWCTPDVMDEELNGIGIVSTLLSVYGRMKMAHGLACHPSATGHDTLTQSLIECYENDYTTTDETAENLKVILDMIKADPDLVYPYAYSRIVEEGYIDEAMAEVAKVRELILLAKEQVESDILGTTEELKASILAEIDMLLATLDKIDSVLTSDTYVKLETSLLSLEGEIDAHIASIEAILEQAGYDVEFVLVPALEEAKQYFLDNTLPCLIETAKEYAWIAVDYLLTNIDYIYYNLPSIANTVYEEALRVAILAQVFVGEKYEEAFDAYLCIYGVVSDYLTDFKAKIEETDRIIHEIYTTLAVLDERLGYVSRDYLDGLSIVEWAELLNEMYYYGPLRDLEDIVEPYKAMIMQIAECADGYLAEGVELYKTLVVILTEAYGVSDEALTVAGQIFSYVYDFVVEHDVMGNLKGHLDNIVDLIAATYRNTKDVNAVGSEIYAYVLNMFAHTFEADYVITAKSSYVALGNATYGKELAEMLHLGDSYYNYALNGNYLEQLAKADLVTIRIDNGELINFVKNNIFSTEPLNWDKHLDAEGQAALEVLLASFRKAITESGVADELAVYLEDYIKAMFGIDPDTDGFSIPAENVAQILSYAIELVIYGYADSIDNLEAVIANVNAVAPNATVVITGAQNPIAALGLDSMGLDLEPYMPIVDGLMSIFNTQFVAIAYTYDNIIYVDSVDAADIYAALNAVCAHDYDDCEDAVCNICGETRVAPGHDWSDWKTVKAPTDTEEGRAERTCKECGKRESKVLPIEPLGFIDDPKPFPWIWIVVAVVLIGGGVGYYFYYKKNNPTSAGTKK